MLKYTLPALFLAGAAQADVPKVATDILPVHSLVSKVMEGVGKPALLVRPGASPHGYALTPREAGALQDADVVIWVGPALAPWLEERVGKLAGGASLLTLMTAEGTAHLPRRDKLKLPEIEGEHEHDHDDHAHEEGHDHDHEEHGDKDAHDHGDHDHEEHAKEDAHDHDDHGDHEEHDHEEHGHDDHDHEGHDDHDDHDEHAHDDHDDHDHGPIDPHVWLNPNNGAAWLPVIAEELARLDPENAAIYRANAKSGQQEIATLVAELQALLDPVKSKGAVVFHDAYQYFENSFGLTPSVPVNLSDATRASAARVKAIKDHVDAAGITCAMTEPQFNPQMLTAVFGDQMTVGKIDPLGAAIDQGPDQYGALLRAMAGSFADCLGE